MVAIPFVRDMTFVYGQADQLTPLVRRLVARNPGPFTYLGTGVYIIGTGEVAVIDPGPPIDAHLEALKGALSGERVTHVFTTHSHSDHSPLAHPLARWAGCKVFGLPDPSIRHDHGSLEEEGEEGFTPDIAVKDGDIFTGPGWTLEALTTPGHMSNHVCYALREENSLFSGDHIMGWSTTVISPPDGHMGHYYRSLEKVKARQFTTLWPTHGPPVQAVESFIDAYLGHRRAREAAILERLRAGDARIPDIVRTIYKDVDARLHPAAARSVLAHMIHLVECGDVRADGPPSLTARYEPS